MLMVMIMVVIISSWETSPKSPWTLLLVDHFDRNIALALAPPPAEEVAGPVT